jgi:hypothetical protein
MRARLRSGCRCRGCTAVRVVETPAVARLRLPAELWVLPGPPRLSPALHCQLAHDLAAPCVAPKGDPADNQVCRLLSKPASPAGKLYRAGLLITPADLLAMGGLDKLLIIRVHGILPSGRLAGACAWVAAAALSL